MPHENTVLIQHYSRWVYLRVTRETKSHIWGNCWWHNDGKAGFVNFESDRYQQKEIVARNLTPEQWAEWEALIEKQEDENGEIYWRHVRERNAKLVAMDPKAEIPPYHGPDADAETEAKSSS